MKEMIKQPTHYMSNGEETIVKIVRELGISGAIQFCKGNIIKYADRANYKGQKESDLNKIKEYRQMAEDLTTIEKRVFESYGQASFSPFTFRCIDSETICKVKEWSENGHSLEGIL